MSENDPFYRLFVAIELPEAVRSALAAVQAEWQRVHADVGWVPVVNMHLSLQFLGDVAAGKTGELADALELAADAVAPFTFEVRGCGVFGPRLTPRVVWSRVTACPPLFALQKRVTAALDAAGCPVDQRVYRPHLTLGRVRSRRGCDALLAHVTKCADRPFGAVDVRHITLFRSRLLPQGAEHTVLHCAPLGGWQPAAP